MRLNKWTYYLMLTWCVPWCYVAAGYSMRFVLSHTPLDSHTAGMLVALASILAIIIVITNIRMHAFSRYCTVALLILYVLISQGAIILKYRHGYYSKTPTLPLTPFIALIDLYVVYLFLAKPYRAFYAEQGQTQAKVYPLYNVK